MWPFRTKAPRPPPEWSGPVSFSDWTEDNISAMSAAIRKNGQSESDGFRRIARISLNTLRGGSAVELVSRAIHESYNPHLDPDGPIEFGSNYNYLNGHQNWCMWTEYARPAVDHFAKR